MLTFLFNQVNNGNLLVFSNDFRKILFRFMKSKVRVERQNETGPRT